MLAVSCTECFQSLTLGQSNGTQIANASACVFEREIGKTYIFFVIKGTKFVLLALILKNGAALSADN
jgi:hypothetical protein